MTKATSTEAAAVAEADTPDESAAVEVSELVKVFPAPGGGKLTAVDGVSFKVDRGEIFGFLGPNGAGKTTTLEIIEGLQRATSGRTWVLGVDSQRETAEVKERIGVQLQAGAYFDFLTLEEILDLFGSFYSKRVEPAELLERVGLIDKRKALVKELSGGQQQRFSIVAAMVNDPEVVFLDEPTTGLDPQARRNLWDLIAQINRDGEKTVMLTTHYMEEAEFLCDRVAVIDAGKIVALDSPQALVRALPSASRIVVTFGRPPDARALESLAGVTAVAATAEGDHVCELSTSSVTEALSALIEWAREASVGIDDIRVVAADLEDVFLDLTGRSLRD